MGHFDNSTVHWAVLQPFQWQHTWQLEQLAISKQTAILIAEHCD